MVSEENAREAWCSSCLDIYLVDPASGHMLVSKIKPCMSEHELKQVKPRIAHYNSHCSLDHDIPTWITVAILELIRAFKLRPHCGTSAFIRTRPIRLAWIG